MSKLVQNTETWVQFTLRDRTTNDPILGIPANEVDFFYKKHDALAFTAKALVDVVDNSDPQPGENFAHVGYGVYAVLFTAANLDTLGSLTWVAQQSGIAVQDFQTVVTVEDVTRGEDFVDTIYDIQTDLTALDADMTTRFNTVDTTLTAIQTMLTTMDTKLDAIQVTLASIEGEIPSGVTAQFTES
jgi:flagellin-like hook-associated protein FlgL